MGEGLEGDVLEARLGEIVSSAPGGWGAGWGAGRGGAGGVELIQGQER